MGNKTELILLVYALWLGFNLYVLFENKTNFNYKEEFYPIETVHTVTFDFDDKQSGQTFHITGKTTSYDYSEFAVFTILPLLFLVPFIRRNVSNSPSIEPVQENSPEV